MKKGLLLKLIVACMLIFILFFSITITCHASDSLDTSKYNGATEATEIINKVIPIVSILRNLAVIVAVVVITIIGIQFMIGSVEEKASYKEKLMPVLIGAILISTLGTILTMINSIMQ